MSGEDIYKILTLGSFSTNVRNHSLTHLVTYIFLYLSSLVVYETDYVMFTPKKDEVLEGNDLLQVEINWEKESLSQNPTWICNLFLFEYSI